MTKSWPELIQSNIQPPETITEAVDRLMEILGGEEKLMIALMPEDELIDLHFGLGSAIRNAFGLLGEFKQTTPKSHRISFRATAGVVLNQFGTSQF